MGENDRSVAVPVATADVACEICLVSQDRLGKVRSTASFEDRWLNVRRQISTTPYTTYT
jgi:hypothetical protein